MLRLYIFFSQLIRFDKAIALCPGQVLDHQKIIDDFVAKTRDLRHLELSADDWDVKTLVARWLKTFRSATTQMSSTKRPMLSSTHAIFHGLQESIRGFIKDLPHDTPPHLHVALLNAHRKLSDYYYKFDESPYYVWAGSKCNTVHDQFNLLITISS
jgi:hypothetical protein